MLAGLVAGRNKAKECSENKGACQRPGRAVIVTQRNCGTWSCAMLKKTCQCDCPLSATRPKKQKQTAFCLSLPAEHPLSAEHVARRQKGD